MSVYMSMRIKGDPAKLEEVAASNREMLKGIAGRAQEQGCIHHRFAGRDGEIVVIDEWESEEAFQRFFEGEDDIPKLMQEVGVTEQPQPAFWRPLEIGDEF